MGAEDRIEQSAGRGAPAGAVFCRAVLLNAAMGFPPRERGPPAGFWVAGAPAGTPGERLLSSTAIGLPPKETLLASLENCTCFLAMGLPPKEGLGCWGPCWHPNPPHLAPPHLRAGVGGSGQHHNHYDAGAGARASHDHHHRHPRQRSHGVHRGLLYAPAAFPRRFAKGPRRAAASTSNPLLKMRVLRLASKLVIAFIGPQLMQ